MHLVSLRSLLLFCLAFVLPLSACAQDFSLVITPPRFEDRAKPGDTYRNVFELTNVSSRNASFTVSTADWVLDAKGSPVFSTELAQGSCRPWVGIEANTITVRGGGKRRFRFEVAVPADAPRGECRFAIMVEGEPQIARGSVPLPISGRIGVIVYLSIGDAAPNLVVTETRAIDIQGARLPSLRVRNEGDMHGRLDGFLTGTDAANNRFDFVPDNSPILVGATRDIPLYAQPSADGRPLPAIVYPLRIKGRLDAERQRLDIDTTLER